MSEPTAVMFVFAGNNGSGKSTIRNLIIDRLGISVNVDPYSLARRIDNEILKGIEYRLVKKLKSAC